MIFVFILLLHMFSNYFPFSYNLGARIFSNSWVNYRKFFDFNLIIFFFFPNYYIAIYFYRVRLRVGTIWKHLILMNLFMIMKIV
jgi:hypothetical protein